MKESTSSPPEHLSGNDLADWWRKQEGMDMNSIPTLENLERICSYCGAINPCTGNSTCIQCEHTLEDAHRTTRSTQHTDGSQNW